VGRIDPVTLEGLQLLAGGFMQRDAGLMARALRRMVGVQGTELDIAAVETDMAGILGHLGAGGGLDPTLLAAVLDILSRHQVAAPRALTLLARAALTLDGTLRTVDPGFAMGVRAQALMGPLAGAILADQPRDLLRAELMRALPSLRPMPQLAEDLALQARAGRLTIRSERFATGDRAVVDGWVDRVLFVAIGMVGVLTSVLLLGAAVLAGDTPVAQYLYGLGFSGLFLTSAMLLRAVAQIQRRERPR
jgi:ubiquinone biosynthesis protein